MILYHLKKFSSMINHCRITMTHSWISLNKFIRQIDSSPTIITSFIIIDKSIIRIITLGIRLISVISHAFWIGLTLIFILSLVSSFVLYIFYKCFWAFYKVYVVFSFFMYKMFYITFPIFSYCIFILLLPLWLETKIAKVKTKQNPLF